MAVGEKPKFIKDVGVFAVTSLFSLFAYVWLLIVLESMTAGAVDVAEAWITLFLFVILIVVSYGADKINEYLEHAKKTSEELDEQKRAEETKA